ncbi:MAG: alpha-L-fucosidase [Candidatus Sumerlaeota bacterium]|nr:alpha-L-fucosidase [Candidatus Sumerlaeota bacterium]
MAAKPKLTAEEKDRIGRMKWWHEAKFGMFIHWGLYSVIGRHEWAMEIEAIPDAEYRLLAQRFKPKPNAARDWAKLAKRAGMKYMVMTTKHHEGFCLFHTKTTDYCAPKQACGRDLVAEYVQAARAEGLRVGFYYSLMDWHHPDGAKCLTDEEARKRFVQYIHTQVRELMTNYGKVDILWYDVSWPLSAEGWESRRMNRMVRRLQPDIIINNRSKVPEDFSTPEQRIVAESGGRAWEACMTMNDSWGYHKSDRNWKTPDQIIRNLITCAGGGGNYLLNIGPKPDGSIPAPSVAILNAVGEWMDRYGATICTSEPCAVTRSRCAQFTRAGKTLYVHVHSWPGEGWGIGGLKCKVKAARIYSKGPSLKFEQDRLRLRFLNLPANAPYRRIPVLALECSAAPAQDMAMVRTQRKRGKV